MSNRTNRDESSSLREARRVGRREFVGIGVRTAAVLGTLPATAVWGVGCGGGEESSPEPPAAGRAPAPVPDKPAPAPKEPAPPPAAPKSPAPPSAGADSGSDLPLVTDVPHLAGTVAALQYTHESAKPDQKCQNCQLYTAGQGGLGQCSLFQGGRVKEGGWCMSWVEKVS